MTSTPIQATTQSSRTEAPHRRLTIIASFTGVVLATVSLAALAVAAHSTPYFGIDLEIARAVQSYHAEWFRLFMHALSWPGFPPQMNILVGLICVLLFLVFSRWKALSFAFGALGIAAMHVGLKVLVGRPRPSPELIHVVDPTLIGNGVGLTFPAGHVAVAVAVFGFLGYLAYTSRKRSLWRTLFLVGLVAFLVLLGLSRIYEGEHWFSDVIGGYLLGSLWLIFTIYLYEWGKARFFLKRHPETHQPV